MKIVRIIIHLVVAMHKACLPAQCLCFSSLVKAGGVNSVSRITKKFLEMK